MDGQLKDRFERLHRAHVAQYAVVSLDPTIISLVLYGDELEDFLPKFRLLFQGLGEAPLHCLCCFGCHLSRDVAARVARLEADCRGEFPSVSLTFICNQPDEPAQFNARGAEAVYCNKNCFLDERLFHPVPGAIRRFDAVYDSRFLPIKRHDLAHRIDRLALIYYPTPNEDLEYVQQVKQELARAHFFNHPGGGPFRMLSPAEVNAALNECRVGLCLSAEEGAMMASSQYLLSGLPVVTTPSRGGRDVWYEDWFVRTVEPDPRAVADAVAELVAKPPPASDIRAATLRKVHPHREVFFDLVQRIFDRLGVRRSFRDEWSSVFTNRMVQHLGHQDTIARVLAARRAGGCR